MLNSDHPSTLTISAQCIRLASFGFSLILAFAALLSAATVSASPAEDNKEKVLLEQQRKDYQAARTALRAGQLTRFRQLRASLADYPLVAYLDYYELNRRLSRLPNDDIDRFLAHYHDSHLADKLRHRWLLQLASRQQWTAYLSYHPQDTDNARLQCLALEAQHRLGDPSALSRA